MPARSGITRLGEIFASLTLSVSVSVSLSLSPFLLLPRVACGGHVSVCISFVLVSLLTIARVRHDVFFGQV